MKAPFSDAQASVSLASLAMDMPVGALSPSFVDGPPVAAFITSSDLNVGQAVGVNVGAVKGLIVVGPEGIGVDPVAGALGVDIEGVGEAVGTAVVGVDIEGVGDAVGTAVVGVDIDGVDEAVGTAVAGVKSSAARLGSFVGAAVPEVD